MPGVNGIKKSLGSKNGADVLRSCFAGEPSRYNCNQPTRRLSRPAFAQK